MNNDKKKRGKGFIVILVCIVVGLIIAVSIYINSLTIIRDGEVRGHWVKIAGEDYIYTRFITEGRRKKIAEIDGWGIYEVKEDPSHTFLKLKSFTSQEYIVREDYIIPKEGKVSCAYAEGERVTDGKIIDALSGVLSAEYGEGVPYSMSGKREEQERWIGFAVGFEDCPVGTDFSIYAIGKIDSKWVVIFRSELGGWKGDYLQTVYHEIDPKYYEVFEKSGIWKQQLFQGNG